MGADSSVAAIWSAIAATASAVSAFILLRIHVRTSRDSVRPEIVLSGWRRFKERTEGHEFDVVEVSEIENAGRGPAMDFRIFASGYYFPRHGGGNQPLLQRHETVTICNPGKTHKVVLRLTIGWHWNVPNSVIDLGDRHVMPVRLLIYFTDLHGRQHELEHRLHILKEPDNRTFHDTGRVAAGVFLYFRRPRIYPAWRSPLSPRYRSVTARVREVESDIRRRLKLR